jgi:large subunit ribosomal protein L21
MVSVIAVGGKQYVVDVDQKVKIDGLRLKVGDSLEYQDMLDSKKTIKGKVVQSGLGKKINIVKFKNKTRYTRHKGHRQPYSIIEISDNTGKKTAPKKIAKKSNETSK